MMTNGMNDFQDFLEAYPTYSCFYCNPVAEELFLCLSELENVQDMILASEAGQPALQGCIQQIERRFGGQSIFDLTDNFSKQAVGTMCKVILEPFGFQSAKQKVLPKGLSKYFRSATVYEKTGSPRLKLVSKLSVEKV